MEGLVDWVVSNVGRPALNFGVVCVCLALMLMRAHMVWIGCVALGGFGLANYQEIAGFFGF